jgi:hypothetical protein
MKGVITYFNSNWLLQETTWFTYKLGAFDGKYSFIIENNTIELQT